MLQLIFNQPKELSTCQANLKAATTQSQSLKKQDRSAKVLGFYCASFAGMLIASLLLFRSKGSISALCGIVLFSYLSFFTLYYTSYTGDFYTALDSIRIGLITVLIMHCGLKSDHPAMYLLYALILIANLAINGLSIIVDGFIIYVDYFYLTIAIFEILIFCIGVNKTLKIKSRKGDVALHFGSIGSINNYWSGPDGSVDATAKGARK